MAWDLRRCLSYKTQLKPDTKMIHVDVWQKPPQYYKVIILQLK